jgi:hypothetical protein
MFEKLRMAQEILDAIIQIGMENPAGWTQLITSLEFHSTQQNDVYLGRGLTKLADALKAHGGG